MVWRMRQLCITTLRKGPSSSILLSNIKMGRVSINFKGKKSQISNRHWIVRFMTLFFPSGTKRRHFASICYQKLRRSFYCLKAMSKQRNIESRFQDPVVAQIKQQNHELIRLRDLYIEPYLSTLNKIEDTSRLPEGEKIVWQYWNTGVNNAPKIVRACIESVRRNLPQGYKHVVLDDSVISKYVEIPDFVLSKMRKNSSFKPTFFSDLLRLFLLSKYGGVWIDATVLLTSSIPEDVLKSDFFCFYRGSKPTQVEIYEKFNPMYFSWRRDFLVRMCNSFLVAKPSHPFTEALKAILLDYWRNEPKFSYYFTLQITFEYLIHNERFNSINWNHYDDLKFHELLFICKQNFNKSDWNNVCHRLFAHKLTYYTNVDDTSYYSLIQSGELK